MAELSPFLNEHPMERAFTLGTLGGEIASATGERVEVTVHADNQLMYTSGQIRLENLKKLNVNVKMRVRERARINTRIRYVRYVTLVPYGAVVPVNLGVSSSRKGVKTLWISGSSASFSSAVRLARTRVGGRIPFPSRTRDRRTSSSTLRPNPENIFVPFYRIQEVMQSGSYTTFSHEVVPVGRYSRSWTGVRTPNFARLKKSQLPDNPHTVTIHDYTDLRYSRYTKSFLPNTYSLHYAPYFDVYGLPAEPSPAAAGLTEAHNKSLQKLISKAQVGIQANFAQNFAQMSQLTNMVAGNAIQIVKSLQQLKRGNIPGAVSALSAGRKSRIPSSSGLSIKKSVANNWLQLQYGWKPLLQDIEGLLKILPNLSSSVGQVQRVTEKASAKRVFTYPYPPGDSVIGVDNHGKTTYNYSTHVKWTIRYKIEDEWTQFLAQTGFTNPINLAWEILPFSFVADWFLPVGQYLASTSAFHGLRFLGGTKVVVTRLKADAAIGYNGPVVGVPGSTVHLNANLQFYRVSVDRSVLTDFPAGEWPEFEPNPFKNSTLNPFQGSSQSSKGEQAGNNRALNALALLQTVFRR